MRSAPITRLTTGSIPRSNYENQDEVNRGYTAAAAPREGEPADILLPYNPPAPQVAPIDLTAPVPGEREAPIDVDAPRFPPLAREVDVVNALYCHFCQSDIVGGGVRLCANPDCTSAMCIDCMHARPVAEVHCTNNCNYNN